MRRPLARGPTRQLVTPCVAARPGDSSEAPGDVVLRKVLCVEIYFSTRQTSHGTKISQNSMPITAADECAGYPRGPDRLRKIRTARIELATYMKRSDAPTPRSAQPRKGTRICPRALTRHDDAGLHGGGGGGARSYSLRSSTAAASSPTSSSTLSRSRAKRSSCGRGASAQGVSVREEGAQGEASDGEEEEEEEEEGGRVAPAPATRSAA